MAIRNLVAQGRGGDGKRKGRMVPGSACEDGFRSPSPVLVSGCPGAKVPPRRPRWHAPRYFQGDRASLGASDGVIHNRDSRAVACLLASAEQGRVAGGLERDAGRPPQQRDVSIEIAPRARPKSPRRRTVRNIILSAPSRHRASSSQGLLPQVISATIATTTPLPH